MNDIDEMEQNSQHKRASVAANALTGTVNLDMWMELMTPRMEKHICGDPGVRGLRCLSVFPAVGCVARCMAGASQAMVERDRTDRHRPCCRAQLVVGSCL